ncbi:glycosyltransferase family 2 protein [Magnetospirillum molischianum]|uniref:Putative glycosyl transferase n=1 Tax=Magnetospirillum molischianum DSM 120 TaxID=1150626 RepID=H8FXG1_MAGML|nr:glycosyltransferase family 2 protein [Magnetospirillum molischianum]CCG43049.1 Putative glycosyl transferase [Magnetospirillum molischianum DSM 120]
MVSLSPSAGISVHSFPQSLRIAVLVPCYNEEAAIGTVVRAFRESLPTASVYVYDNNSDDRTIEFAKAAGAVVRTEPLQGKGHVVRRMFADIEADVYVLVDGDDTYHAASAPILVQRLLTDRVDMVNGARVTDIKAAYRPGHRFGNVLLTSIVSSIFGNRIKDMLSGYRVFSRRFVKSFPALSSGFEIETELTVHALELEMPVVEVETPYKDRPVGSVSKLRTFRDGLRILATILVLVKEERPLSFFSVGFAIFGLVSVVLIEPVLVTYLQTGLVPRFPTAILSMGVMLMGFLSLTCGVILDTVTRTRKEMRRFQYLQIPFDRSPSASDC